MIRSWTAPFVLCLAACATAPSSPDAPTQQPSPGTAPTPGAATVAPPPITSTAQRAFDDAVAAVEEARTLGVWDWERLEKKWREVLEQDDKIGEVHHNLGVIAERRGKPDEAKASYRRALERKPSLKATAQNLAALLAEEGDVAGAVATLEDILEEWPEDAGARAALAELHRRRGDDESAARLAREALARDPKSAPGLKVLMRIALGKKDTDMARLLALRAQKVAPQDPEIFDVLGQMHEMAGDEQAAIAAYRQALRASPEFLPARVRLARIAMAQKDWPGAVEELSAVAARAPRSAAVHLALGVAQRGVGALDQAEAEYKKALELDEKLAEASFDLAVLHHKFKDDQATALPLYKDYLRARTPPAHHPAYALLKEAEELLRAKKQMEEMEKQAKATAEAEEKKAKAAEEEAKKTGDVARAGDGSSDAAPPAARAPKSPPADEATAKGRTPREEGEPE